MESCHQQSMGAADQDRPPSGSHQLPCILHIHVSACMYTCTSLLLQNREMEITIFSRDADSSAAPPTLCGLVDLKLEDYFDTSSSSTHCLPLEPQGILLAEVCRHMTVT